MALEIERKFKLKSMPMLVGVDFQELKQGYLGMGSLTTRVRVSTFVNEAPKAWITVKSPPLPSLARACHEWEYEIPASDAEEILSQPDIAMIHKTRYYLHQGELCFEIDAYHGPLEGLWTVEVELPADNYNIELPEWVGQELTGQYQWSNEVLAHNGLPTGA